MLQSCSSLFSQSISIIGQILDGKTKEPLPFVSIYIDHSNQITTSDFNGNFYLHNISLNDKIKTIYLGYKSFEFKVTKDSNFTILLVQDLNYLNEVTVTSKKTKYKRKQNPALEIINKTIENKSINEFSINNLYGFKTYEKIKFNIVPLSEKFLKRKEIRPFKQLISYTDSSKNELSLPIYIKETFKTKSINTFNDSILEIIDSIRLATIDNLNKSFDLTIYMNQLYQQINLYKVNIHLFDHEYTSPLSSIGTLLYKYYIMDTLYINNIKSVKIGFVPVLSSDFLFQGYLYIALDSTYALIKNYLTFNKNINLNWITHFDLEQTFVKLYNQKYIMNSEIMNLKFKTTMIDLPITAKKLTQRYQYINRSPSTNIDSSQNISKSILDVQDSINISKLSSENSKIFTTFDSIKNSTSYRNLMKIIQLSITGFYPLNYIEIGSIFSSISFNPIEKIKFNLGFRTTYKFYKLLRIEGSLAYGLKDNKLKYNLNSTLSLNHKNVLLFPKKSLSLIYINDLFIFGQSVLTPSKSNVLLSFERTKNDFWIYNKLIKFEYNQEFKNHFSYKVGLTNSIIIPLSSLHFNTKNYNNIIEDFPNINSTDALIELKFSPNEKFYQGPNTRYRLKSYAPVFTIQCTYNLINNINLQSNYVKLNLNVIKRFNLFKFGKLDFNSEFGKSFGRINFPYLYIPPANQTYFNDISGFNLMNYLEFVNDQYLQILIDHQLEGFSLNKIPYVRKLKLREFINFKILFGSLSSTNNPSSNSNLFKFPTNNGDVPITYSLNKSPYIEGSIGIGNIFRVLRIDLVKRFTYLDHKNIASIGLRAKINFQF